MTGRQWKFAGLVDRDDVRAQRLKANREALAMRSQKRQVDKLKLAITLCPPSPVTAKQPDPHAVAKWLDEIRVRERAEKTPLGYFRDEPEPEPELEQPESEAEQKARLELEARIAVIRDAKIARSLRDGDDHLTYAELDDLLPDQSPKVRKRHATP